MRYLPCGPSDVLVIFDKVFTASIFLRIASSNPVKCLEPYNIEFKLLINEFASRLTTQVKKRRLNHDFLKNAELTIIGIPDEPSPYYGRMAPNKVSCRLVIVDDLNREHISEANTWCREHNPEKELKSTREYE